MDDAQLSIRSPLRPVDARSRIAATLVRAARAASTRVYDPATCQIVAYLYIRRRSGLSAVKRDRVPARYADLHQAFELREAGEARLRAAIEAMLLTPISLDVIASRVGVEPACIGWYAAAFFDVRDRLSCPQFIVNHVIEACRELSGGDWFQHGWKLVAYLGDDTALQEAMGASKVTSLAEWVSLLRQETRVVLQEKIRRLTYDLPAGDSAPITKLLELFEATARSSEQHAPNAYEANVQAMMETIQFTVGMHTDTNSRLAEFEHCPAELRADEMMRVGLGRKLPDAEKILSATFPKPPKQSET